MCELTRHLSRKLREAEHQYYEAVEPFDKLAFQIHAAGFKPKFILHKDGEIESLGCLDSNAEALIAQLQETKDCLYHKIVTPKQLELQRHYVFGH